MPGSKLLLETFQPKNISRLNLDSCRRGLFELMKSIASDTELSSDAMQSLKTAFSNVHEVNPELLKRALTVQPRQNLFWNSLFYEAQGTKNLSLIKLFLTFGADPSLQNSNGLSAMQIAAASSCNDTLAAYLEHGGDINSGLYREVGGAKGLYCRSLSSRQGATPLYYLVKAENGAGFKLALQAGVYLDDAQFKKIEASRVLRPIFQDYEDKYHLFLTNVYSEYPRYPQYSMGLPKKAHAELCEPFKDAICSAEPPKNVPPALLEEYAAAHEHVLTP